AGAPGARTRKTFPEMKQTLNSSMFASTRRSAGRCSRAHNLWLGSHPPYRRPAGRKSIAQLAHGALENRMPHLGGDFRQRLEDEPALVHGRMRNGELRRVHNSVAKKHDIDINDTRSLGLQPTPSHGLLDRQNAG